MMIKDDLCYGTLARLYRDVENLPHRSHGWWPGWLDYGGTGLWVSHAAGELKVQWGHRCPGPGLGGGHGEDRPSEKAPYVPLGIFSRTLIR